MKGYKKGSLHSLNAVPESHSVLVISMDSILIRCLVIVVVLALETSSAPLSSEVPLSDWEEFKRAYNKTYATPEEEQRKFNVFKGHVAEIEEHNRAYKMGEKLWEMEVTRHTDWTVAELRSLLPKIPKDQLQLTKPQ